MIKIILKGGLGNQMFQYAFAKSIALEKNDELILDTTFLETRLPVKDFTIRNYELDLFDVKDKQTRFYQNALLNSRFGYLSEKILNRFNKDYISEGLNPYLYDESIVSRALNYKNPVLEGYFNNYKYFQEHRDGIMNMFNVDKLYDSKHDEIENMIKNSNSVSINIRRGDYLNSKHKNVFVNLQKDYYDQSIKQIRDKIQNPKFFVFSYDDPEWIKNELAFSKEELFIVNKEYVGDRFKTYLRLISLCKHNIISNSTFAFWGAYLNKNKDTIVLSPKKWMTDYDFETPNSWMTL